MERYVCNQRGPSPTETSPTPKPSLHLRFHARIAEAVKQNLRRLENGYWVRVEQAWNLLSTADDQGLERETARMIAKELKGFGPKQARNLLQALGLTKYEIPIDSRVGKRLVQFGCPLPISRQALAARKGFELVLDGAQELCRRCGVYPCMLDAAMFASFDGDGWDGIKVIW